MPARLRLGDFMASDGPELIGRCSSDVVQCAAIVNRAQKRLLTCREVGDEGWWGTWAEIAFTVSQSEPFITTPRDVARLESINACTYPVPLNNQFYEYLRFGDGRLPKSSCVGNNSCLTKGFTRNNAITFTDLTAGNLIRIYPSDEDDFGKRVLIGGLDTNNQPVLSLDGVIQVNGVMVELGTPFVDAKLNGVTLNWNAISGIQKDITLGSVSFYGVDPDTGDQELLLTMQPSEEVAGYRRYYLNGLPQGCCPTPGADTDTEVEVTAIAQLEAIPVKTVTDYLLLTSLEAIIAECQAIRMASMDSDSSKAQAAVYHREAIRFLQGELVHYAGKTQPAVNFAPFGTARLVCQKIGSNF